jgi:hypothetical protein
VKAGEEREEAPAAPDASGDGRNGFQVPVTVTLKRSGKTMRTLAMSKSLCHLKLKVVIFFCFVNSY